MSIPGLTRGQMKQEKFEMPDVLLEPWLRVGDRMMLHAGDGLGKSWVAMAVAMAVAGGGSVMGWQATRPAKVLFIDAELSFAELDARQSALLHTLEDVDEAALDENLRTVSQVDFGQDAGEWPTPERDTDELLRWAGEHGAELVVFDNVFGLTEVTDANQAAQWRPLIQLTRRLKSSRCASLLVHHDSKTGAHSPTGYSGSADLSRELDVRLHMQPMKAREQGEAAFRLTCRKDRHGRFKDWSEAVSLRGSMDSLRWEIGDVTGQDKADDGPDDVGLLLEAAETGSFRTSAALADAVGKHPSWVSRTRDKAVKEGSLSGGLGRDWLKAYAVADAVA